MTRNDYRAECLEAMEEAYWKAFESHDTVREYLIAAFDALHGVAVVYTRDDDCYIYCRGGRMLIGDAGLTNPPEKKL